MLIFFEAESEISQQAWLEPEMRRPLLSSSGLHVDHHSTEVKVGGIVAGIRVDEDGR
jgi:hypothetical protein